jgi:hypothetical protein
MEHLALPQSNQSAIISIPKVPTTLDDSLTAYANKNGFSTPKACGGFGYLEYRNLLVKEREIKLKALNLTETTTALAAETHSQSVPQTAEQENIDRFNAMLEYVTEEKTLQDIAFETNQCYVLRALGIPPVLMPLKIQAPPAAKQPNDPEFDAMMLKSIALLEE